MRAWGTASVYDGLEGVDLMFGPRMVPPMGSQAWLGVVSIRFNLRLSRSVGGLSRDYGVEAEGLGIVEVCLNWFETVSSCRQMRGGPCWRGSGDFLLLGRPVL